MVVVCTVCGRTVWFPDETAGTHQKCFYCNRETLVSVSSGLPRTENPLGLISYEEKTPPEQKESSPASEEIPEPPPVVLQPSEAWGRRYLWLSLALIPLVFSLLSSSAKEDVSQRLFRTLSKLSNDEQRLVTEWVAKGKEKSPPPIDGLLTVLPGHRIEGAHLSRDSWMHWVYGGAAAALFGSLLIFAFPSPTAKSANLIRAGLYTGTLGIFLLLVFQVAAAVTQGVWLKSIVLAVPFYIVKFIGFSYVAALDPSSGFLLSAVGFTFGVGFCEEVCKLIPAIKRVRRWEKIDWRGVYLLGLASGMGFGISEGITYASDYYNGIQTSGIYAVRFISCVALHAIWSGAAAITLFNRQDELHAVGTYVYLWRLLRIVSVPMVLHGLYDTLLKKQMDSLALAVAFVSFAWMAFQFERMRLHESRVEQPVTP